MLFPGGLLFIRTFRREWWAVLWLSRLKSKLKISSESRTMLVLTKLAEEASGNGVWQKNKCLFRAFVVRKRVNFQDPAPTFHIVHHYSWNMTIFAAFHF